MTWLSFISILDMFKNKAYFLEHHPKRIEPNAPQSSDRFKAMEQLANYGIYTGMTLMPILPFINDTKHNIENLLKKAKDSGASYVIAMFGVTLRKGSREYFYEVLDNDFPAIKEKYQALYGDNYMCFSSNYAKLTNIYRELSTKLGLDTKIRFYEPKIGKQQSLIF